MPQKRFSTSCNHIYEPFFRSAFSFYKYHISDQSIHNIWFRMGCSKIKTVSINWMLFFQFTSYTNDLISRRICMSFLVVVGCAWLLNMLSWIDITYMYLSCTGWHVFFWRFITFRRKWFDTKCTTIISP